MGSHEPACPKVPGPKTINEKAYYQTKIVYNQEKPKINLLENKKVQKTVKIRERPKTVRNIK